jgi:hypothetical protein
MPIKENPYTSNDTREKEKALLGAYIMGAVIGEGITENVFMNNAHKTIFSVIREIKENNLDLDLLILVNELRKQNKLDTVGGAGYVATLTDTICSAANTSYYEGEVLREHKGRSLLRAVETATEDLRGRKDIDEVEGNLRSTLDMVTVTTAAENQDTGILFKDLAKKEFPPEDWIIDGLITTGLTVLTGASKIGKSFTALQLTTALDQGGYFLGALKAKKCDVLYCALEDTPKRIQKRLKKQGII